MIWRQKWETFVDGRDTPGLPSPKPRKPKVRK
jgi:hypothetical protein